jgi:hypothetical protein
MDSVVGIFGVVGSSFLSLWVMLKYVLLCRYRLDASTSKNFLDVIRRDGRSTWVLGGDHAVHPRYPNVWEVLTIVDGIPLFYSRHELMLTAGWKGKEEQTTLIFPRFMKRRMDSLLQRDPSSRTVPVNLLCPGDPDRLGEIEIDQHASPPSLDPVVYSDIENDVQRVLNRQIKKTGAILYGAPGNGKSRFVKYLASKYALPIYVVQLGVDWNNHNILVMFASIPKRCIVLLEDFDNHFHGREPAIKNDSVKFTFDSVINSLDGVHNDYDQVIFIMTVNDLSKVDDSLKDRPSRFRFVREFGPPSAAVRATILKDDSLVDVTEGLSLDKVYAIADRPEMITKKVLDNRQLKLSF